MSQPLVYTYTEALSPYTSIARSISSARHPACTCHHNHHHHQNHHHQNHIISQNHWPGATFCNTHEHHCLTLFWPSSELGTRPGLEATTSLVWYAFLIGHHTEIYDPSKIIKSGAQAIALVYFFRAAPEDSSRS